MSNSLAIAAVTTTLQSLLQNALLVPVFPNDNTLADIQVTVRPPDKARDSINSNQLNIFLYQTLPNAAWRNLDVPTRVKQGETGFPPLPLNLYYMLTAYGKDDNDILGHRILGRAMNTLHDHPLLGTAEIQVAFPESDLQNQFERVRFTLQPLSVEEIFRLWSGFLTQYRLSVAYEATVVLIESTSPVKTPLPVLTRGRGDTGIAAQADTLLPLPTLTGITPPNQQSSAKPGDILTINGFHLDVTNPSVRFTNSTLNLVFTSPPGPGGSATTMTVTVPDDPLNFPAGVYTLDVLFTRDDGASAETNEFPLSVAPRIDSITPKVAPAGNVTYTVQCSPAVQPQQHASLLLGSIETPLPLQSPNAPATQQLVFDVPNLTAGDYFVRLRVDGIDSLLVNQSTTPPTFDQSQRVTIQ